MKKICLLIVLFAQTLGAQGNPHGIWQEHEESARYAIVQVVNHSKTINPLEPFKRTHEEKQAGGSGFFINDNGELLTNYHVVENAQRLYIMLPSIDSRRRFDIELVGCKPARDVALCRLTEKSKRDFKNFLQTVPGCNGMIQHLDLAPDDQLQPIQQVMALGYPLLDGFKRTIGEINGISLHTGTLYCQISAPINHGSSGGPTLNQYGQVVGINSAGIESASVVGYMIPVHYFRNLINDLREHRVITFSMGISLHPATKNILDTLSCPKKGLLATHIATGGLADDIGFKVGDIIMAINGSDLDNDGLISADWIDCKVPFKDVIERAPLGQKLAINVWRDGAEVILTGAIPATSNAETGTVYPEQGTIPYAAFGGLVAQPLRSNHLILARSPEGGISNIDLIHFLYDPQKQMKKRIIITKVYASSQAELEPALFAGAVLEKVDGHTIRTLDDLSKAVTNATGDFLTIELADGSRAALHMPTMQQEDEYLREVHGYQPLLKQDS